MEVKLAVNPRDPVCERGEELAVRKFRRDKVCASGFCRGRDILAVYSNQSRGEMLRTRRNTDRESARTKERMARDIKMRAFLTRRTNLFQ